MMPYLTVGMPAYNEAENLPVNVPRLGAKLDELGVSYEIVVVDDGSADATGRIAQDLARRDERVRVCRHAENRGIGAGFMTAAAAARGEFFIIVPADLALDLDQLPKYLDAAQDADVIVGQSTARTDNSAIRRLVSWANVFLIRALFRMPQRQFNYVSMYRTRVLRETDIRYTGSALFYAEILVKARDLGYRLRTVDIAYVPRAGGRQTGTRPGLVLRTARDLLHFRLTYRGRPRA